MSSAPNVKGTIAAEMLKAKCLIRKREVQARTSNKKRRMNARAAVLASKFHEPRTNNAK